MKTFKDYLMEASSSTVTITFGRFNPPTIGHEKLMNAVKKSSVAGEYKIFVSQTQDKKDNPIEFKQKMEFISESFPEFKSHIVNDKSIKTIIEAAKSLSGKFKNLRVVVGEDRVQKFEELLNDYNGKEYQFDAIEVISAGLRDPDSDGVDGVSASKVRKAAKDGDFQAFKKGISKSLSTESQTKMFELIKGNK